MLCMAEKAGLMHHNGHFKTDAMKRKIALGAKRGSPVDSLVETCAQSKGTPEHTAVKMWICFVQNDIHYYHRL